MRYQVVNVSTQQCTLRFESYCEACEFCRAQSARYYVFDEEATMILFRNWT